MLPLFVIAPMNRSGTNYLREILLCHDEIQRPFCNEDYSLAYTNELLTFVNSTAKHWGPKHTDARDRLQVALSNTIIDFFKGDLPASRYLLLTSPRPWGIKNVVPLFPDAKLLFLVRDGRNTVASACKSFRHGSFNFWSRQWRQGAEEVLKFAQQYASLRGTSWEIVTYEKLNSSLDDATRFMLEFLDLDPRGFHQDKVSRIPLWGSAEHGIGKKVEKPPHFINNERYRSWSTFQRCKFHLLAGKDNQRLQALAAQSHRSPLSESKSTNGVPEQR